MNKLKNSDKVFGSTGKSPNTAYKQLRNNCFGIYLYVFSAFCVVEGTVGSLRYYFRSIFVLKNFLRKISMRYIG